MRGAWAEIASEPWDLVGLLVLEVPGVTSCTRNTDLLRRNYFYQFVVARVQHPKSSAVDSTCRGTAQYLSKWTAYGPNLKLG